MKNDNKNKFSVIYPVHNRYYYTLFTFPRLLDECRKSKNFSHLFIYDDESLDGTSSFLRSIRMDKIIPNKFIIQRKKINNSTNQINETYQNSESEFIIKIDNDTLIPEGCFNIALNLIIENREYGFLGIGHWPRTNFPIIDKEIKIIDAKHIGGIGIFRRKVFDQLGLINKEGRFFGFSNFQNQAKKCGWKIGWIKGLKVLDLDESESYSHVDIYKRKGWGRNIVGKINSIFNPQL